MLIATLDQAFQIALKGDTIRADGGTFVACFSTDGDSLPQWRGYGASDSSFSICLDATALLTHIQAVSDTTCWLLPVQYDWDHFVANVSKALSIAEQEFDEHLADHDPRLLIELLLRRIANYGSALKHQSFKEEREWRLICLKLLSDTQPRVNHAPTATLRPYVELRMPDEFLQRALKGVIVGPQSRQDTVVHGVWSFLKTELGVEIPVTPSEVPYRLMK